MAHTEVGFTYEQALRTLGVTPEKLDRLIDEGAIKTVPGSVVTLVPRESILAYLATVTSVGKEKKKAAPPAKEAASAKAAPASRAEPPSAKAEAPPKVDGATVPAEAAPPADEPTAEAPRASAPAEAPAAGAAAGATEAKATEPGPAADAPAAADAGQALPETAQPGQGAVEREQ